MNEEKGVFLRGKVLWISYQGPLPDGSWGLIRESAKTSDPKAASKFRAKRIREALNHRDGIHAFESPSKARRTVGELLDALKAAYETRKLKSLRQVRVHLKPLRAFFGFQRASSVNEARISAYIADRRAGNEEERTKAVSDTTIDRELELLRVAFHLGKVSYAPKIPKLVPENSNARSGFWEREEFERFLVELPSELLRDVWRFGYWSGWRKGEILSLTWNGYDRETKKVYLHASAAKTGKGRNISLDGWPELADVIERRMQARRLDCPLIFQSDGHKVGDFYTTARRAMKRAGVKDRTFHDLRRTAIRNNIRAGTTTTVAKELSGHKTDSVFERYNITSDVDLIEAGKRRASYEASLPKK